MLNVNLLSYIVKTKRCVFSLWLGLLRFALRRRATFMRALLVSLRHVKVGVDHPVRLLGAPAQHRLRVLQLHRALHALGEIEAAVVVAGSHHHQRALGLLLGLVALVVARAALGVVRHVAVLHEVLLVDVPDGLEVALGRLELEAVALLQRDLEVLFVLRLRRKRLALGQGLVEEGSRDELRVLLVRDGRRVLRGQADIYVLVMRGG